MGACATKPKGAELESGMPLPVDDSAVSERKIDEIKIEEEAKVEETKERRSLSNLFQENEEVKESSEKESEILIKESDIPKQVEQEQPKIDYPALTVSSSEETAAKVAEPVLVAIEEPKKEETKPEPIVLDQKEETPLPILSSTTTEVSSGGFAEKK